MLIPAAPASPVKEVRRAGSQVVARPDALIARLPLHVQARIACIDAIAANSRSMLDTANSIMREVGA